MLSLLTSGADAASLAQPLLLGVFMVASVQVLFVVSLAMCATLVFCGLLVVVSRLIPLLRRQRAALWGVEQ